ncbi:hypothetical protein Tco_0687604, partial [Tanacetum coccineum]
MSSMSEDIQCASSDTRRTLNHFYKSTLVMMADTSCRDGGSVVVMVVAGGDSGVLEWWLWRVVARRWSGGGGWVVRRLVVGSNDGGGVGSGGWRWCGGDVLRVWHEGIIMCCWWFYDGDNDEMVMGMMVAFVGDGGWSRGDGGGAENLKWRGERILVASGDDVDVVVRVAVKMMVTMVPWWFGGAASSGDDRGGVRVAVAVAVMVVVVWCGCGDDSIDGCHGVAA